MFFSNVSGSSLGCGQLPDLPELSPGLPGADCGRVRGRDGARLRSEDALQREVRQVATLGILCRAHWPNVGT